MVDLATLDHIRRSGDIFYERFSSSVGDIFILGNDSSLKAILYRDSYPAKKNIATFFTRGSSVAITKTIRILDRYFQGFNSRNKGRTAKPPRHRTNLKNRSLDLTMYGITVNLDLSWYTLKEIQVYGELLKIPTGSTISYGDLAWKSGIPGGARFVGNTMAKNSFPIIIPCHRVIRSDGSMGNYSGGVNIKKHLLDIEQY
ncbi:MAG: MGMT family protein [Spirochaetes bacterium]|nr:MGMT family protein [Spirochaetota bacterium]